MLYNSLVFFFSAALIVWAGRRLTSSADEIARFLGLGGFWAGVLLLPLSTSLPELVTGLRALDIASHDLLMGNILGSNMMNISLIAYLDFLQGPGALIPKLSRHHRVSTFIFSSMSLLVVLGLIFPLSIFNIGVPLIIIAILYLTSGLYFSKREEEEEENVKEKEEEIGESILDQKIKKRKFRKNAISFLVSGVVIIFAGVQLVDAAESLAEILLLDRTVVGTLLLAIATSLPEIITTAIAVKLGFFDMAIGNIFGANLLNFFALFIFDIIYRQGPLLQTVSSLHIITAVAGAVIGLLTFIALLRRSLRTVANIGLDSLIITTSYFIALVVLFFAGNFIY